MRNEYIPKVLKEYRKKNQYTVNDVSLMLHERSIDVAPKTIYGWESGQANPSADMLLTLCELYNIENILSAFGYSDTENFHITAAEKDVIEHYREHPELQEAVGVLLGCRPRRKVRTSINSAKSSTKKS
ncbi:MAG: helix-turn-helix transcriptional regulator [Roseburia sp.]|nr:helix-turn-helix transcriptional regulator [Roseburia sp.]